MSAKKKLRDYLSRSVRKIKHRKGFGVHSPFAYSIITEVIEEKLPYYAYRRMNRTYDSKAPIAMKVACLLLRLANRFRVRQVAELCCDGGYSLLPLILTDSRLHVQAYITQDDIAQQVQTRLAWLPSRLPQVSFAKDFDALDAVSPYDMIIVGGNPFDAHLDRPTEEQQAESAARLVDWIMAHAKDDTLIFVRGIQARHRQESFWDLLCDRDDVSITMDLYDYGLAILKPRFFKQHYIVAF